MATSVLRVTRRVAAAGTAAVLALAPAVTAGAAATTTVKLPTEADALAVAVNIERILNGSRGVETRLPGPVADRERVDVSFGTDGSLVAVSDEQRMRLSGLGDFEFKVPGPATDVEALPGSESEPGLRRGSVIWQGFCDGSKSIGARLDLIPGQEQVRLPLRLRLAMTVDGRPVEPGHAYSGRLHLRMTVTNNSSLPIQVVDGDVGLERGAAILDAIRADLRAGRRPVPGSAGIPPAIELSNPAFRQTNLEAPIEIGGALVPGPGRFVVDRATGVEPGGGVAFTALLGGGAPLSHTVDVTAEVRGFRVPGLVITAASAPPSVEALRPPAGATWTAGVRSDPAAFDAHAMTGLIMDTMWRTARLRQFDAYLGNPDPTGPASTTYRFVLAPAAPAAAAPPAGSSAGIVGTLAGAGIALVLVLGAVVAWSRS
jgi:hypothetical protein